MTFLYIRSITTALRYEPLPNLTELDIHLPSAHDFGELFPLKTSHLQISFTDVARCLRHLGLLVGVHTRHETRDWAPISRKDARPRNIYGKYLFSIIESAIRLTSLAISATDMLELGCVSFSPFLRLRSLYLCRAHISARNLCSLIDQSSDSIKYIKLRMVGLKSGKTSGTWKHVLLQMAKLPHLIDFGIDSSGYSRLGSSSHLDSSFILAQTEMQTIATLDPSDYSTLGHLQRAVNANRTATGLRPFSERKYMFLELPPLEYGMSDVRQGL